MFTILIRRNITSTQYAKPSGQNSQKFIPSTFKGFIHEMPAYVLPGDCAIPWDDDVRFKISGKVSKKTY